MPECASLSAFFRSMLEEHHLAAYDKITEAALRCSACMNVEQGESEAAHDLSIALEETPTGILGKAVRGQLETLFGDAQNMEALGHSIEALKQAVTDAEWRRMLRQAQRRQFDPKIKVNPEVETIIRGQTVAPERVAEMLNKCLDNDERGSEDKKWTAEKVHGELVKTAERHTGTVFFVKIANGNSKSNGDTYHIGGCALVKGFTQNRKFIGQVVVMEEIVPGAAQMLAAHFISRRIPLYYNRMIYTGSMRAPFTDIAAGAPD